MIRDIMGPKRYAKTPIISAKEPHRVIPVRKMANSSCRTHCVGTDLFGKEIQIRSLGRTLEVSQHADLLDQGAPECDASEGDGRDVAFEEAARQPCAHTQGS